MTHPFTVSFAIGAASFFGIFVFDSSIAVAKSVASCHGDTGASVVACCEKVVAQSGMPSWMSRADLNCHEIVACSIKKKSDKRCYVKARSLSRELGGQKGNEGGESKMR